MLEANFVKQPIKQLTAALCATALGLGICIAPAVAFAEIPSKITITRNPSQHYMLIRADQTDYYVYTVGAPPSCFNVSEDLLKEWQTIAQTALIGGKNLSFSYTLCESTKRFVTNITIGQ